MEIAKEDVLRMWKASGDLEIIGMPYAKIEAFAKLAIQHDRNRLADELEKMPLNDTAASIAIWIRNHQ